MSEYPKVLYARVEDEGTDNEFLLTSPDIADLVDGDRVKAARYVLVGEGSIYHSAPTYIGG